MGSQNNSMSYIVSRCMLLYWLLKGIQLEDTNHQAVEFYLLRLSLAAETGRMWQGTSALSRPHMSSTALKETKPQLNNFLNLPKLSLHINLLWTPLKPMQSIFTFIQSHPKSVGSFSASTGQFFSQGALKAELKEKCPQLCFSGKNISRIS